MTRERLYIILLDTLAPGAKIAQAIHAARAFQARHTADELAWYQASNTVAVLETDANALRDLYYNARLAGVRVAEFREPDMGDALTAVALAPCVESACLCKGLRPALA